MCKAICLTTRLHKERNAHFKKVVGLQFIFGPIGAAIADDIAKSICFCY